MSPLDKLALWLAKAGLRITPWNLKCALDSIGITAGFMEEVAVIRSLESRGYLERIRIGLSDADCFPCILTAKGEEAAREIPDDPCHLIREIRESALVRA